MSFDTPMRILSPSGANVNLRTIGPDQPPLAAIQINHGLAEHSGRYKRFAELLASHGFATFAHDHRGHGHTTAPDATLGSFARGRNGAQAVLIDILAVHDHIAERYPGTPIIVFGHSMGALIALNFVSKFPGRVAGAAIWNGNFGSGMLAKAADLILAWEQFRIGSDVPSRLLPRLTFRDWARRASDGRTDFDWLSHDHDEVDRYVADPLCEWLPSVGMWRSIFELAAAGAGDRTLARIPRNLPISLVGGAEDPATNFGRAVTALERRMSRLGFLNLNSRIYAQTRHESLNELNRNLISADFVQWAKEAVLSVGTTPTR